MNPDASKGRDLTAEEIAKLVDWIDGNLSQEDAIAFEQELSADPALARTAEEFAGLDALVRRGSPASVGSTRTWPRWGTWVALAAAAVLVIAIGTRYFASDTPRCEVALAPGFALAEDWTQQVPDLAGASAPGIAMARGPNSKPLAADEFLRRTAVAEQAVAAGALEARRRDLDAGWFVVPIELSESAVIVVMGFPQGGSGVRLFPAYEFGPERYGEMILDAGRHILPSSRAIHGQTSGTLEYAPGFLVPIGAKQLTVLVALRQITMGPPSRTEIDGWLASGESADQVAERLRQQGFKIERLVVREPK